MRTLATNGTVSTQAKLFRGLADPSRLAILVSLKAGPRNVGQVVRATGQSQPNVSQHLNCLRCCGLVVSERRGRFVYYRLASPRLLRLLALADGVLDEVKELIDACENYNGRLS